MPYRWNRGILIHICAGLDMFEWTSSFS